MAGWHHWCNGHEQTSGDGEGQRGLCAAVHGVSQSRTQLSDWTSILEQSGMLWGGSYTYKRSLWRQREEQPARLRQQQEGPTLTPTSNSPPLLGSKIWALTLIRPFISQARLFPYELSCHDLTCSPQLKKKNTPGTSLVVQWLRLWASTAGDLGSLPGQGTKIPMLAQHSQN